jgi:hypothetical protein
MYARRTFFTIHLHVFVVRSDTTRLGINYQNAAATLELVITRGGCKMPYLIARGADVNTTETDGMTPLNMFSSIAIPTST